MRRVLQTLITLDFGASALTIGRDLYGARVVDERDALWASIDAHRAILARERRRHDSRRTRRAKERARHRSRASDDGARVDNRAGAHIDDRVALELGEQARLLVLARLPRLAREDVDEERVGEAETRG